MLNLTTTQARMVACSLEIDGRADIAAQAAVPGHITEFTHRNGEPASPKARRVADIQASIKTAAAAHGLPALIAELREGRPV